ncbi:hypothetical protein ILYODFUR_035411 [Ilyodon furcidens]|uniref:Uncharacterized protein n=1 Tax=Ilyodon furcidens TaxID=33524 RepID=A0ABV0VLA1_9TELE
MPSRHQLRCDLSANLRASSVWTLCYSKVPGNYSALQYSAGLDSPTNKRRTQKMQMMSTEWWGFLHHEPQGDEDDVYCPLEGVFFCLPGF